MLAARCRRPSSRRSPPTTSSPARPSPSTCPRPASGSRIASGLIDVAVTLALLVARRAGLRRGRACSADDALHLGGRASAPLIVVFLVVPTTHRDADPRQVARQAGARAAHGPRRRRADHVPARVRPGAGRRRRDLRASPGAPAFFSALLSSRGKRLGDYAAGTYVVRERVRLRLAPPAADAAAAGRRGPRGADIASLPDRARRWRCASSSAGCRSSTPPPGAAIGGRPGRRGQRRTSPRRRRPAPRPRRSSPRWSPPAASATRRGSPARPSSAGGSPPVGELAAAPGQDVAASSGRAPS